MAFYISEMRFQFRCMYISFSSIETRIMSWLLTGLTATFLSHAICSNQLITRLSQVSHLPVVLTHSHIPVSTQWSSVRHWCSCHSKMSRCSFTSPINVNSTATLCNFYFFLFVFLFFLLLVISSQLCPETGKHLLFLLFLLDIPQVNKPSHSG